MVAVPFPSLSSPDKLQESGGRLRNAYAEKLADGRTAWRAAPGLREAINSGIASACRGMIEVNGSVLAIIGERVLVLTYSSGVYALTDVGELLGSETVYLARNNKTSPDIAAVTSSSAYVLSLSGAPAAYPDADVGSPNSVSFQGGYFIFTYGNGIMRNTSLNSTAIATTDFATAESRPDTLLRTIPTGRDIIAFGASSVEWWRNTGASPGFPFEFVDARGTGLIGSGAVSGWEPGFPDGHICFVGSDGIVYRVQGYQLARVSTHTVERAIARTGNPSLIEASVHMFDGHVIWCMSSPDWTWCYDITTGSWFERGAGYSGRWVQSNSVNAYGKWLAGTSSDGRIAEIDPTYRADINAPLVVTIDSATMSALPNRAVADRLVISCMTGVGVTDGDAPEVSPKIRLSWSRDGGATFGNSVERDIGSAGEYETDVTVNRLGRVSHQGLKIRVEYSGKTDFTLFGGDLSVRRVA